ncbi:transcriptional regulator [Actinophytocola sp.]|uniref:transcriptional regulator n=1 Tax=Actinophytocola sp. TaxID=1872138 RepID=UPI002ED0D923
MHRATRFAVLLGVRHAIHHLSDYWLQTDHQALTKGLTGPDGASACARHVATYTVANAVSIALASRVFGLRLTTRGIIAGELVSAATHYTADRRDHGLLFWLANRFRKGEYLKRGGAPYLDQSWHHVFNALAAAVTAVVDDDSNA